MKNNIKIIESRNSIDSIKGMEAGLLMNFNYLDEADIVKDSIILNKMKIVRNNEIQRIQEIVRRYNNINYNRIKNIIYDSFDKMDFDFGIDIIDSTKFYFLPVLDVNKNILLISKYPSETLRALELDTLKNFIDGKAFFLLPNNNIMMIIISQSGIYPKSSISYWEKNNRFDSTNSHFTTEVDNQMISGGFWGDSIGCSFTKQLFERNFLQFLLSRWKGILGVNWQGFIVYNNDVYKNNLFDYGKHDFDNLNFDKEELKNNRLINILYDMKENE